MDNDLGSLISRIINEVREGGNSPEAIRRGVETFAKGYQGITDKTIKGQYDDAAKKFIITVVGQDNLTGIELYSSVYESMKRGPASLEPLPLPTNLEK